MSDLYPEEAMRALWSVDRNKVRPFAYGTNSVNGEKA